MTTKPSHRVLITCPLADEVRAQLEATAASLGLELELDILDSANHDLANRIRNGGHTAILCQLTDRIDADLLHAARATLRVVSSISVGLDHIDTDCAAELGIAVCNTPGVLTAATADLAFALLLAVARRISEADRFVRAGHWTGWRPDLLLGHELEGTQLGIVGFGRIGRAMARRGRGFGMQIRYASRSPVSARVEQELDAARLDLDALCATSDYLSLHVPGTPETEALFDAQRFANCKPGMILINTARGSVLDQQALIDALTLGRLAGAGLDVFEDEPRVPESLRSRDDVVLTPHIGSATHTTRRRMADLAIRQLCEQLAR